MDNKKIYDNEYEFSLYDVSDDGVLYIQFNKSIKIPSKPIGWKYDSNANSISADVSTDNYSKYLKDLFKNLISLMNWIENLKDISIDESN